MEIDEDNPYEGKWSPVIRDEENEILQAEYRIANFLRKKFNLDGMKEGLGIDE